MTLNLLLFAITFTIFLEIEFDFIFYVPYRSEEISPRVWSVYLKHGGSGIVQFDDGLQGGIDLAVPQDVDSAQGWVWSCATRQRARSAVVLARGAKPQAWVLRMAY